MAVKSPLERLKSAPQLFRFDAAVRLLRAGRLCRRKDDKIAFVAPPFSPSLLSEVLEAQPPLPGSAPGW